MTKSAKNTLDSKHIRLREPRRDDGMAVHRLIADCRPLDTNSSYCNLLQCDHFAATSVTAEIDGKIAGFISAYPLPEQPDTLFVWQVAVAEGARGMGLASKMLMHLLQRDACRDIRHLHTSITADNSASWALFQRLADALSAPLRDCDWLDKHHHFDGLHDSERLVKIGPLTAEQQEYRGAA